MYLAVRKNVTYIVRILSAYFPNFIVHRGQQQNNRSTWTPCVISSSKQPDTMKYFCIAGLDLPYISFVRPIMCEIIYVLYRTPWSSVRKFWVLVFDYYYCYYYSICFSLHDITCSWEISETSLGLWSISNDVKNWTIMRKWIRFSVIGREYNRPILPAI